MLSSSDGSCSLDALEKPKELTMVTETEERHITHRRSSLQYRLVSEEEDVQPQVKTDHPAQMSPEELENVKHLLRFVDLDGRGHITKLWQCGVCYKTFKQQYTLQRHLPTHTDQRDYKCTDCGKAFRQLSTLSQHRSIHSNARPYVCPVCTKTFNRVSSLISHRKIHLDQKMFVCQTCGKGFHQKGNLRNHEFTHTNSRPYICNTCGRGFNQRSNLICHQNHAHNEGPPKYSCNICGGQFRMAGALKQHQASVHDIKHHSVIRGGQNKSRETGRRPAAGRQIQAIFTPSCDPAEEIIIEPINNAALARTKARGQIPFALFKPLRGPSMLVKINDTIDKKQALSAADASDIMAASGTRKVSSNPGRRSQHIQVPVVATLVQRLDESGQPALFVESAPSSCVRHNTSTLESTLDSTDVNDFAPYARKNSQELYEILCNETFFESQYTENGTEKSYDQYESLQPYIMVSETDEETKAEVRDEREEFVLEIHSKEPERVGSGETPANHKLFIPTSMKIQRTGQDRDKTKRVKRLKPRGHRLFVQPNSIQEETTKSGIDDLLEFAANTGGVLLARENKDGSFQFITEEQVAVVPSDLQEISTNSLTREVVSGDLSILVQEENSQEVVLYTEETECDEVIWERQSSGE